MHLPHCPIVGANSDDGKVFACHKQISGMLGYDVCFARFCSRRELGTHENMNDVIRQCFPKGTDCVQ